MQRFFVLTLAAFAVTTNASCQHNCNATCNVPSTEEGCAEKAFSSSEVTCSPKDNSIVKAPCYEATFIDSIVTCESKTSTLGTIVGGCTNATFTNSNVICRGANSCEGATFVDSIVTCEPPSDAANDDSAPSCRKAKFLGLDISKTRSSTTCIGKHACTEATFSDRAQASCEGTEACLNAVMTAHIHKLIALDNHHASKQLFCTVLRTPLPHFQSSSARGSNPVNSYMEPITI